MVRTRLSLFCDRIIEAGWLVAAIVTPLFFNFYSNRVFEANKAMLLRSIALVMAAAWIIKVTEVGGWKKVDRPRFTFHVSRFTLLVSGIWDRISKTPLVLPTLLFAAIYLLSTLSPSSSGSVSGALTIVGRASTLPSVTSLSSSRR